MKIIKSIAVLLVAGGTLSFSVAAVADWYTVHITYIHTVTDAMYATSDLPGVRVVITGTFSPTLPCARQEFLLVPTDPLFKENYSMFVAAQLSGKPIQYEHIYCTSPSGIGRGNRYALGGP